MSKIKDFNRKISEGKIEIEYKICLCNSDDFTKVIDKDRYGLWHSVVMCKRCGLVQANPTLTSQEFEKFYNSDLYRKIYSGDNFIKESDSRYVNNNQIFDMLKPYLEKYNCNTILEFGCGGGWNLIPFINAGYDAIGYDLGEGLIDYGRDNYNLNLKYGSFNAIDKTKKYDVLILNHVVEHFVHFEKEIKQLAEICKDGGLVYVGLPTIDLVNRGQFQNAHNFYFTERTLLHYMNKYGFEALTLEADEAIHMHGVFLINKKENLKNDLSNEFSVMRKKLLFGRVKIHIINSIEKIGLLNALKALRRLIR
jgi:2-polyprenyl-3-methyl-5-hydroxy-6-metoxy-1,4-benzoquinol methylase